jgi:hypothetical protein
MTIQDGWKSVVTLNSDLWKHFFLRSLCFHCNSMKTMKCNYTCTYDFSNAVDLSDRYILVVQNSNMTSFIGYRTNTVIKLLNMMHIVEQIINIIHKWINVFIHDRGAYNKIFFCFLTFNFPRKKNTEDNLLSTLTCYFVIFRWSSLQGKLVTLTQARYWFIFRFCEHFTFLSC